MKYTDTALILIGYQNDFFSPSGILHSIIEKTESLYCVLANTLNLITQLQQTSVLIVATPIAFSKDYHELEDEPVGVLKAIKDARAFQAGEWGSATIAALTAFGERIDYLHGKHGFNAFANTYLSQFLNVKAIKNVIIAGAVTSICVESTARAAAEQGFSVYLLSDCTAARTVVEQEFYCQHIFPIYAQVIDHQNLLALMQSANA
jgi:nicotinamidase-related amidase